MKISQVLMVALLINNSSAIRVGQKDDDGLNLPIIQDQNDIQIDKKIVESQKTFTNTAKEDTTLISTFEKQLDQALRNAEQGEMGRALAVSKLSQIKLNVETLESNLKKEANMLQE